MSASLFAGQAWLSLRSLRKRQKFLGNLAAIFLTIALLSMADGLIASMRKGNYGLELLPGQNLAVSGPAASRNPLPSDLSARFNPQDCPMRFQLEGFFTGYWFGSGMWRGEIIAEPGASDARCRLDISFRGMPASSIQRYEISLFPDEQALRDAARSILMRFTGLNPFYLAACCALCGCVCGLLTYFMGRAYDRGLGRLGLAQVYGPAPDGETFFCAAPKRRFAALQGQLAVYSEEGQTIGQASLVGWQKGKWRFRSLDGGMPPAGSLLMGKADR